MLSQPSHDFHLLKVRPTCDVHDQESQLLPVPECKERNLTEEGPTLKDMVTELRRERSGTCSYHNKKATFLSEGISSQNSMLYAMP